MAVPPAFATHGARRVMRHTVQRTRVHNIKIHEPVSVIIQPATAGAVGLNDVRDFRIAELVDKPDAGLLCHILKKIVRLRGERGRNRQRGHGLSRGTPARRGTADGALEKEHQGQATSHAQDSDDHSLEEPAATFPAPRAFPLGQRLLNFLFFRHMG